MSVKVILHILKIVRPNIYVFVYMYNHQISKYESQVFFSNTEVIALKSSKDHGLYSFQSP